MTNMIPRKATIDSEIERCFDVMSELRPDLERDTFLETVREMELQGFRAEPEAAGLPLVQSADI